MCKKNHKCSTKAFFLMKERQKLCISKNKKGQKNRNWIYSYDCPNVELLPQYVFSRKLTFKYERCLKEFQYLAFKNDGLGPECSKMQYMILNSDKICSIINNVLNNSWRLNLCKC